MKQSNKSSLITGVVLLAIAAFFSISLILQPLDFGFTGPGHNNIFYALGKMLFTVYGFSSILIPVFLFVSGLSCFATKWTARKTMRLLTAIVPFFTSVITENIIRSIVELGKTDFMGVKIAVAVVTGIMLIVIEFLGIGILADKLNVLFYEKTGLKAPETTDSASDNHKNITSDAKEDSDNVISENDYQPIKTSSIFDEALANVIEEEVPSFEEKEEIISATSVLSKNENQDSTNPNSENEQTISNDSDTQLEEDTETSLESDEPQINPDEFIVENEADNNSDKSETPASAEIKTETTDDDETERNPASIITQDEYAALIFQEEEPEPQPEVEELEWNNLPPAPAELPDDYKEEIFDEDDPSLEFPPKEEKSAQSENEISEYAESENQEETYEISAPDTEESDTSYELENDEEADESEENYQEYDLTYEEETPYSAARYIDTVVENPKFPHGIILSDDEEEEPEEKIVSEPEKPKYPSKISLSDEEDDLENEFAEFDKTLNSQTNYEPEINQNFENTFTDDENTEEDFTEFEEKKPVITEKDFTEFENSLSNEKPASSNQYENKIEKEESLPPSSKSFYEKITEPEEKKGFASAVSSVFSDMEEDIRRNQPIPEVQKEDADTAFEANFQEDDEDSEENKEDIAIDGSISEPDIDLTATNLTKDELSDFFNAQQEEMRPKGNEIMANPPKVGNRATKKGPYIIPSDLLIAYKDDQYWIIDEATKQASLNLKQTLAEFNIEAEIIGIKKGPVVTMFEILPAPGVKLSKIVALQDNIALSLAAQSVRIVAPIPGKQAVGIEVPNQHRSIVGFREIIEMDLPEWKKMSVPVVLGKDILGKAQLIDLVKTPHMLIAGATGSGKSVCVNSLILSILYKRSYKDVKLILVDPKVVELKLYNNIPHLLTPVITEPKKALQALQYCLCEMERRYALLDGMGVRDISTYNQKIKDQKIATEKLPYIIVIIDEFADLMATSGRELESIVARLTAMSRAVGIHLVLATQRPSVNVITGLIKANIPTRISFMVSSRTDSNIIIDSVGAEKLLGRGDMLFASATDPAPVRIQGTFISDQEVEDVVKAVKEYGEPDYIDDEIFVDDDEDVARDLFGDPMDDDDPLYDQALEIVVQSGKASASYLQRRLKIGYNRAARLVEEMEERGIVGPANGSKPREIIHMP